MSVTINGDTGIDKITDGSVVAADIGAGEVGSTQIASGAVGATQLASTLDLTGKTVTLPAGVGGKILQVVHANYGTQVLTSSTSYSDTGLTATITPSSASNKILVIFNINGTYSNGATGLYGRVKLLRTSTELMTNVFGQNETTTSAYGSAGGNYLDSPSTTSATTYKVQIKNDAASGDIGMNTFGSTSNITLIEVAG